MVTAAQDIPACIWRVFPSTQELIDHAKRLLARGLTLKEREGYFLDLEPPAWWIETEKWPYHTAEWKQWLADARAGRNPLPKAEF